MKSVSSVLFVLCLVSASCAQTEAWQVLLAKADSLQKAAQYDSALILAQQALEITEWEYGKEDTSVARALWLIGVVDFGLGRFSDAEAVCLRSLAIRERVLGPHHVDVARSLNTLANACLFGGKISEAEPLYRRALEVFGNVLGPRHPAVAMSLNNLSNFYWKQGRISEAVPLCGQALDLAEQNLGPDHPEVAVYSNNLSNLYAMQGRYSDAEPLQRRTLAIREQVLGFNHCDVAQSLGNLSTLLYCQGRYLEAEPLTKRAVEISEDILAGDNPEIALWLNNLANIYSAESRYAEAEPLMTRALAIRERSLSPDHPDVAMNLVCIGDLYVAQGRYFDAEPFYRRSLEIYQDSVDPEHPLIAACLSSWAVLAACERNFDAATERESRAWSIRRNNFRDGAAVLAERSALEYSQFLDKEAANYLSILLDTPDGQTKNTSSIADVVVSSKSQVSDGTLARNHSPITEGNGEAAKLADTLKWARFALSKLYVDGPGDDSVAVYRRKLDSATKNKERLEADLARRSASFRRDEDLWNAKSEDVIAALPEGAALVEFMRYEHRLDFKNTEPRYLAVVLKSGSEPAVFALGAAAEIDTAVYWYRRHLANPAKIKPEAYPAISEGIYSRCWRPFAAMLSGASTVFVSPDGALNLISFAGLLNDNGDYLIEDYPLHYLSTGRDLIRLHAESERGQGLLAMGDADFDATAAQRLGVPVAAKSVTPAFFNLGLTRSLRSGCEALSELNAVSLPGTHAEVDALGEIWKRQTAEPDAVYFGVDASEEKFKQECSGKRVIHIATHGFFIGNECRPKGKDAVGENPLLHSGLLLAGANLKGAGTDSLDAEDGIVTAEEIAGLNLHGTDMVVLSACETGLGDVKSGEGVFGLRRAFQMAGARTVVSALWQVDDQYTAALMSGLYAKHESDLPAAMRAAQLGLIKQRRDAGNPAQPFYWAGFVATGAWNTN